MSKHILKIIILFLAFLLTSIIYFSELYSVDLKNQINDVKVSLMFVHKILDNYKMPDINLNYDSSDKTDDSYNENSSVINKKPNDKHNEISKEESSSVLNNNIYDDMIDSYYGRLHIPDLNISVALYYGHQQYITNRADSANIFSFGDNNGFTIADHNNQEFSKLFGAHIGTKGYIEHRDFGRINLECIDVFNGYNIKKDIVDENNISATNRADYMMYTCRNSSENVFICLWNIVSYKN